MCATASFRIVPYNAGTTGENPESLHDFVVQTPFWRKSCISQNAQRITYNTHLPFCQVPVLPER